MNAQLFNELTGVWRILNMPQNEASPQQAAGYQEENPIMMRNHGFSNSSL